MAPSCAQLGQAGGPGGDGLSKEIMDSAPERTKNKMPSWLERLGVLRWFQQDAASRANDKASVTTWNLRFRVLAECIERLLFLSMIE